MLTVIGASAAPVGQIITDSFASLASWTSSGASTWAAGAGVVTAKRVTGSGDDDVMYQSAWLTSSEDYTIKVDWTVGSTNTTSLGVGIGVRGNMSGSPKDAWIKIFASGANQGKIAWGHGSSGAWTQDSISGSGMEIDPGDTIHMELTRDQLHYTVAITNITQGLNNSHSHDAELDGSTDRPETTGNFALWSLSETNTFDNFSVNLNCEAQPSWLFIGDSISNGQQATVPGNRFVNLVVATRGPASWTVEAGGGNKIEDVMNYTNELAAIDARKVFLMIGGNDVSSWGTTPKTNYLIVTAQLQALGAEVIHLLPTPRASADKSPLKDWIVSTFPTSYIDTWTNFLGVGTAPDVTLVEADGIHPNDLGMQQIADDILASPHSYLPIRNAITLSPGITIRGGTLRP